jgi:hypothetical protein
MTAKEITDDCKITWCWCEAKGTNFFTLWMEVFRSTGCTELEIDLQKNVSTNPTNEWRCSLVGVQYGTHRIRSVNTSSRNFRSCRWPDLVSCNSSLFWTSGESILLVPLRLHWACNPGRLPDLQHRDSVTLISHSELIGFRALSVVRYSRNYRKHNISETGSVSVCRW